MHGPASYAGGSYKTPTWPDLPRIKVLDTIAPALRLLRRPLWRHYRDNALARWSAAGLEFKVIEDDPSDYPTFDLSVADETKRLERPMVQPFLRLVRMPGLYGGSIEAVATWLPGTDPAALAAFKLGKTFWLVSIFRRNYLLTHEIGHCLGLNHRPQDESNRSVMNGKVGAWGKPDAHDLDSLKAYYDLTGVGPP